MAHLRAWLNGIRSTWWVLVVALVVAFAVGDAVVRSTHLLELSASEGDVVEAAKVDPSSTTGYADWRRALVLPSGSTDTAHWIMQTQLMLHGGGWRIREVSYDNPPAGRAVHWAGPHRWWLALWAWFDHLVNGRPTGIAVERAALTSGPLMLVLTLLALTSILVRQFGPGAAVLAVVGSVAVGAFYLDFLPGRADHHGLANLCGLGTVLFFVLGARCSSWSGAGGSQASGVDARRWFDASAVAGGVGLWVSAATQVPVLIGLGLGVIAASALSRRKDGASGWVREPALLRRWGLVGAAVSVLSYLIEYAPNHWSLRLEVNHPWYALAWAGAGEALRIVTCASSGRRWSLRRQDALPAGVAMAAMAVLPVTLLLAPQSFTVSDPLMWRIHSLYIAEFQGLIRHLFTPEFNWRRLEVVLPMLLLAPALWRLTSRTAAPETKAWLALALVPALLAWVMGWNQVRWLSLAFALTIPPMAEYLRQLTLPMATARWTAAGVLILLPGLVMAVERARGSTEVTVEQIQSLVERDLAHWLRRRAGDESVVVAAAPGAATKLIYFGSLTGVGTLYWENKTGLEQTAALYGAPSSEVAHAIARRLGLTHIVYLPWDGFELALANLHHGRPESDAIPEDVFITKLLGAAVPPPWLRAIPFSLPDHPALGGAQVRIWEVTEPMDLPDAAVRATAYHLEMKAGERAVQLAPLLARFSDHLPSSVMLAAVAARERDETRFMAALRQVQAQLTQVPLLRLEDHVHLVVVLTVGQEFDAAREQLRLAVQKVDEWTLRRLPAGTLSDLLALTSGLDVPIGDPELRRLAEQLLPPRLRQ